MQLEGKVAIVTGGGQGIGRGIVHCLAKEGADIAVIDINEKTAANVVEEVEAMGRKAQAVIVDVTNSKQVNQGVQEVLDAFGTIDILVNNAGGGVGVRSTIPKEKRTGLRCIDSEEEAWDKTMDYNAKSQFLMCRAAARHFLSQKSGKIVNIASRLARQLDIPLSLYCTAKAACVAYTKHLALELANYNINVNAVGPGDVLTPNIEAAFKRSAELVPENKGKSPEELFLQVAGPRMAFNRIQTPEDMGNAVVFLVSEDAKNITGQVLYVDGGQTFI